jgi:spermidine/putrescine transport system substrate-binding protein
MKGKNLLIFITILSFGVLIFFGAKLAKQLKTPTLEKELNIFNWENYLSDEVIRDFEKKYKVKVNLDTFEDSSLMLSTIQAQPDKYDLVVAEDDLVMTMKKLKLLAPLDHKKIPNLKYLKKESRENFYDPGNLFCLPYVNGYTGIAINKKYIPDYDGTRSILWDKKYKGKISLVNSGYELLVSSLLYLGYRDFEKLTPEKLDEAVNLALKQKDLALGYHDPATQRELLENEEVWVAYIYSTEIPEIQKKNPDIQFFAPKEGAVLWADNFCIPKDAPHKEAAQAFLNYLLEPKVSAKNSQDLGVLMVNEGMKEFLDPEFAKEMEGLDFPKEKEIYEKSDYYNSKLNLFEFLPWINRLEAELGIE